MSSKGRLFLFIAVTSIMALMGLMAFGRPYGDGRTLLENDDRDGTLPSQYANLSHSWGFTDPKPTSAVYNVQWSSVNLGGSVTLTNIEGFTAGGTNVVDLIVAFRTNAAANYTVFGTGIVFTPIYTNVVLNRQIATGWRWGVLTTNVIGVTNFRPSIGYRE